MKDDVFEAVRRSFLEAPGPDGDVRARARSRLSASALSPGSEQARTRWHSPLRHGELILVGAGSSPPELDLHTVARRRPRPRTLVVATLVAALSITALALALVAEPSGKPASASVIVTVHSSAAGAVNGRIPKNALTDGRINWTDVPEYVAVFGGPATSIVGYVKKSDIDGSMPAIGPMNGGTQSPVCGTDGIDVYDSTHTTVVGAVYPGIGYVPSGTTPDCSKYVTATTTEGP